MGLQPFALPAPDEQVSQPLPTTVGQIGCGVTVGQLVEHKQLGAGRAAVARRCAGSLSEELPHLYTSRFRNPAP